MSMTKHRSIHRIGCVSIGQWIKSILLSAIDKKRRLWQRCTVHSAKSFANFILVDRIFISPYYPSSFNVLTLSTGYEFTFLSSLLVHIFTPDRLLAGILEIMADRSNMYHLWLILTIN